MLYFARVALMLIPLPTHVQLVIAAAQLATMPALALVLLVAAAVI